jgi:energy-coupling factor transporter ATP-binding protein EcfA2
MMTLRPLLPTRADQERFVDRTDAASTTNRALDTGRNVLLLGDRGSGKTSLLAHIDHERSSDSTRWVSVTGESAASPAALLLEILALLEPDALERWLTPLGGAEQASQIAQPAVTARLLDQIAVSAGDAIVCVDGIKPEVAHGLFGSSRNEVWAAAGVTWVVAADSAERDLLLRPPADAFFDIVVELAPLDDKDAAELLRRNDVNLTPAQIEQAVAAGGGNPARLLRAAAQGQWSQGPIASPLLAGADGTRRRLLHWITVHGTASAADPAMLQELGVSRQRATQLLRELERHGVLNVVTERPSGHGRPRNVYTPSAPT